MQIDSYVQVDLGVRARSESVAAGMTAEEFYNLAGEKYAKGDDRDAIEACNQAIQLNPNYADAYNDRGIARSSLGEKQGAIADYEQAIKIKPNNASAYYNRGIARLSLGDNQSAIALGKVKLI